VSFANFAVKKLLNREDRKESTAKIAKKPLLVPNFSAIRRSIDSALLNGRAERWKTDG
jgi:hypothetical protein